MILIYTGLYPSILLVTRLRSKEKLNALREETSHEEVSAQDHAIGRKLLTALHQEVSEPLEYLWR